MPGLGLPKKPGRAGCALVSLHRVPRGFARDTMANPGGRFSTIFREWHSVPKVCRAALASW